MEVYGFESFVPIHLSIARIRPPAYYESFKDVVEGLRMGNDRPSDTEISSNRWTAARVKGAQIGRAHV